MSQLTRGGKRRLMYIENKSGDIDGVPARIGWVTFSKTGRTVYYRGRSLQRAKGGGVSGNFFDVVTHDEYWISGAQRSEGDAHYAKPVRVEVDDDAKEEYARIPG